MLISKANQAVPAPARARAPMRLPYLKLLRPKQWIKNLFVLAPLVFTGSFIHSELVMQSLVAAGMFCLASSAGYIFNDLRDLEEDRQHPRKRLTRPLAADQVSVTTAYLILAVLWAVIAATFFFHPRLASALLVYMLVNVAYSLVLKHVAVLDLFTIAFGFVLRVYAGALSLAVPLSLWMFITTLCAALYLAATKRRQELQNVGPHSRPVLLLYTAPLLDYYAQLASTSAVLFYGLFVVTVRPALAATIPLVLFALFRYRYITEVRGKGECPTDALWGDIPLALALGAYAAFSLYIMWP